MPTLTEALGGILQREGTLDQAAESATMPYTQASPDALFGGDGTPGLRIHRAEQAEAGGYDVATLPAPSGSRHFVPPRLTAEGRRRYGARFAEACEITRGARQDSRGGVARFAEAMTTDDFPLYFADITSREVYARYADSAHDYEQVVRTSTVPDFRDVKRFAFDGGESALPIVPEQGPYDAAAVSETPYTFSVAKRGRRLPISWEAWLNDDLDAFRDFPDRLMRAARRSEHRFVTEMLVTTDAFQAIVSAANGNKLTGDPALSIASLETAFTQFSALTDTDGEPITVDGVILWIPPALEVTANNIMNATSIDVTTGAGGGGTAQVIRAANWMSRRVRVFVDPYLPVVMGATKGNTAWALVADPSTTRPAFELGRLRGHITPELFVKAPDARLAGGGDADPTTFGSFENDSIDWKVRHVFGGTAVDPKSIVGSEGDAA